MSATGRSDVRVPQDFYETPAFCTEAIRPYVDVTRGVLDPCCGRGAILDRLGGKGIEINEKYASFARQAHEVECRDALSQEWWPKVGLIITNPPYSLAPFFIDRALEEANKSHATVAMLLRLNYLGSQRRSAWHRAHPCDVYVLDRRPSFTGGGTDATEYCWMCWTPRSFARGFGHIRVLECEKTSRK